MAETFAGCVLYALSAAFRLKLVRRSSKDDDYPKRSVHARCGIDCTRHRTAECLSMLLRNVHYMAIDLSAGQGHCAHRGRFKLASPPKGDSTALPEREPDALAARLVAKTLPAP